MIKKIALFLIALLPVGIMAQDLKLAHVNSQEIIMLMPERADIEKKLNEVQEQNASFMDKMRDEYNTKLKDFVDNQATMPETIKKARQAEIAEMEQRISTFSQESQNDMQKKYQELTAPMLEKVKKAINDAGVEGGYTYIFDISSGGQIVYMSTKTTDLTPSIKKKLGLTALKPVETKPAAAVAKPAADTAKPAETKPAEKK